MALIHRLFAASRIGALAFLLIAPAALAQTGGGTLPPGSTLSHDPADLAQARLDMEQVLSDLEALATDRGFDEIQATVDLAQADLAALPDDELGSYVVTRDQLRDMSQKLQILYALLEPPAGGREAESDLGASPLEKTLPSRFYENFPRAQYSAICGNPQIQTEALRTTYLVYKAAALVNDLANDACDQLYVVGGGSTTSTACIVSTAAFSAAEIVFESIFFCMADAESKRSKAVFLDTEHLHKDIEFMQEDVDFIKDAVTCRPVAPLRRGSGCNGNDDDCDPTPPPRTVDECDEDIFGPLVYIPASVGLTWYPSLAVARVAVEQAVVAMDDCQDVTIAKPIIMGSCDAWSAAVTATDACGNSTTATLQIKIDPTAPQVIIPPSLAGTCFSSAAAAEAAVLAQATIQDDCATPDQMNVRVDSQVEGCNLHVRIEATNPAGLRAVDAVTVRVDPNPPEVRIDAAVSLPWYRTVGEALAAILQGTHATDDCEEITIAAPQLTGTCGSISVRVTATDACGNIRNAQTLVRIDGTPPTVTIPAAVAGRCFATVDAAEAYVRSQTTIVDDCGTVADMRIATTSSVSECGLRVTVEAIDRAGNRGSASTTVRVDVAGPGVEIDRLALGFQGSPLGFQSPRCFASSGAAEAAVLAALRVGDNCTPDGALTKTVTSSGTGCALTVTARVTDTCGQFSTDAVRLRVDTTPPTVTCAVTNNRLIPADKRMVDVGFSFITNDGCDAASVVKTVSVTSDEPTWGAALSPAPDAEILWDPTGTFRGVKLRAEANSPGDGRVYKIKVTVQDACGNVNSCTTIVNVPNASNQNIDSGQNYDAAVLN